MSIDPRDFGVLEGQFKALHEEFKTHKVESKTAIAEVTQKMDELLALANKGRGAYWAGLTAASGIGALVTFIVSFIWPR